ncbi:unnamed protein product [Trichogramma brassicae]|uniref:Integrase catalytic domain-containing protein n=2 Tax=Trichogramma brassicae TaxID=86971 RepID=A0A6H5I3T9_9HYME|nr:unnamed protein product [Trichogramma brassicae]
MSPLTDLLRGLQKKKEKLAWSAQADEAFERIKQAMASAVRSAFYHPGQPLALHTDASNTAIGAALSQRHADDDWTPLGFFSQKLSPTQQRYSTYDRELLAIFEAIKYFQRILEGRSFTIMTDHRPLSFALEQKSDKFSPRQSRQLDFISRFDAKIVYTPGDENPSGIGKFRHTGRPIRSCAHRHRQDASSPRISKLPHDDRPLHTLATGHPDGDMSAQTVAKAFFHGWISFFGTPLTITTDQGAQFEGKLLAQLCKLVGAKHVHTSPYHPQANSMVERMHRTLKAALKCSPETPWTLALPGVLLGLRTTFKEDLQASPAEMVFGTSLRIPGEFVARQEPDKTSPSEFVSALRRRLFQAIRPVPASRHVQHRPFVFKDLATSDYVFRRLDTILKPLEQPYTGPHRVIRRINERNFVVDVNGVAKTLSTDQLKPAYLDVADSGASQATPEQPTTTQPSSTRRVTFSLPAQTAQSIRGGVAVAPQSSPPNTRRSRRQLASRPASPAAESAPLFRAPSDTSTKNKLETKDESPRYPRSLRSASASTRSSAVDSSASRRPAPPAATTSSPSCSNPSCSISATCCIATRPSTSSISS